MLDVINHDFTQPSLINPIATRDVPRCEYLRTHVSKEILDVSTFLKLERYHHSAGLGGPYAQSLIPYRYNPATTPAYMTPLLQRYRLIMVMAQYSDPSILGHALTANLKPDNGVGVRSGVEGELTAPEHEQSKIVTTKEVVASVVIDEHLGPAEFYDAPK